MKTIENQRYQIKSGDEDHILPHAGLSKAGAFSCCRSHRYRQKSKLISQQCSQVHFPIEFFDFICDKTSFFFQYTEKKQEIYQNVRISGMLSEVIQESY